MTLSILQTALLCAKFPLGKIGVLPMRLAQILAPSSALRNALVHAYEDIDEQKVKESVNLVLKYFPQYMKALLHN